MATDTICAKIINGQDNSCNALAKKYYQEAVVINRNDIESYTIFTPDYTGNTPDCKYHVKFKLKQGTTGYMFKGPEAGSSFFGNVDKSRTDFGHPQYLHRVQLLLTAPDEKGKCILDSLDKGNAVVALQFKNGTIEIYGIEYGLTTPDYTLDPQANGGAVQVPLESLEDAQENYLPLVYKSETPGGESADFDSLFSN